ncbi:MAG: hypothetical protein ACYC2W_06410 [Desulfurivibrionaceae bacterium]
MSSGLSFHIAPRALDLEREFSPRILFADSVRHVIDGHVGAEPYYRISTKSVARRLKASALEQRMRELFALDFNPLICMTRQLNSELALFRAWNTYQQHVSLSVRTIIHGHSNEQFTIARRQVSYDIDPPAAREAALCAIDILKGAAMRKREQQDAEGYVRARPSLSAMAATLGLQRSVAFEVTLCLEAMPGLNVAGVCRVLGCAADLGAALQGGWPDAGGAQDGLRARRRDEQPLGRVFPDGNCRRARFQRSGPHDTCLSPGLRPTAVGAPQPRRACIGGGVTGKIVV